MSTYCELIMLAGHSTVIPSQRLKCGSASSIRFQFQPGEGTRRGLLRECEILANLRLKLYTCHEGRDPVFLLFVTAEVLDGSEVEAVVGAHDGAGASAASAHLRHGDGVGESIQTRASVLLRHVNTHQPQISHLLEHFWGKFPSSKDTKVE